ncbi:MAG: NAD(P)-dependent oxidoreductase [Pseudomonadota bacterium]
MIKRILVTGGTGFIGRNALQPLVDAGFDVVALARSAPSEPVEGVTYLACNLKDPEQLSGILNDANASHLLHMAWHDAVSGLWGAPENTDWLLTSLELGHAFLDAGGRRITISGSCGEYDWTSGLCSEDHTPLRPSTVYGSAKVAMLHGLSALCDTRGAELAWGRPFFVYGPREHTSRLGASVVTALLNGEDALCTHGMQLRDYIHCADVGAGLAALAASDLTGEYNLASGQAIRVADLINGFASAMGRPDLVKLGARAAPAYEPPLIVADMQKTRTSELAWAPKFTLETGIADTVRWFQDQ